MYRVKLKIPEYQPNFITDLKVQVGDVNYGGHLSNDAILRLVHQARIEMLASWQMTEMDAGGHGLIMLDSMVQYKAEGFLNDPLQVSIYVLEVSRIGFDLFYRLETVRQGQRIDLAYVKTGMAAFNYQLRQLTPLSEELLKKLR
jgi:acyl-CoA thioester hydrolase